MLKRNVYSKEFKVEAVELTMNSEKTVKEIADDLGISYGNLCKWRTVYLKDQEGGFPGHGNIPESEREYKKLQRELAIVKEERDILKKAMAIFSQSPRRNRNL